MGRVGIIGCNVDYINNIGIYDIDIVERPMSNGLQLEAGLRELLEILRINIIKTIPQGHLRTT